MKNINTKSRQIGAAKRNFEPISHLFSRDIVIMTPQSAPCNKCGAYPKYPGHGLCKQCYFAKAHAKYIVSRRPKLLIPDLPDEEWMDLGEAPGYQISSYGRVKTLNYYDEPGRHAILKPREARINSYLKIDLDKYNWRPSIHKLVALYFVPNPSGYPIVLHKDDNKQNNHKDNLEWGTHSKNRKDYIAYTNNAGIERKKMPTDKVLAIFHSQETTQAIAIKYSVSPCTVWMIKSGYRWSKITGLKSIDKRQYDKIKKC